MNSSPTPSPLLCAAGGPPSPRVAPDQHGAQAASAPTAMATAETPAARPSAPSGQAKRRRYAERTPYTVESIFRNFAIRRVALIRALTTDEEAFFHKCDPGMQPLHLCGNMDGSWEVKPSEMPVPPSPPEAALGINKSRDGMKRHEWLKQVAVHSDAWLINISFCFGLYLTATERERLFTMINSLPTVQETVVSSDTFRHLCDLEEKRCRSGSIEESEEEKEEATGEDKNFCASCGDPYHANGFWICCNSCDYWYHGKCVNITASKAENIEHYECPECRCEKVGHDSDDDPMSSD